jgi:hypothetical protein
MTGVHLSMESGVMSFVKKEKEVYRTDLQTTVESRSRKQRPYPLQRGSCSDLG